MAEIMRAFLVCGVGEIGRAQMKTIKCMANRMHRD